MLEISKYDLLKTFRGILLAYLTSWSFFPISTIWKVKPPGMESNQEFILNYYRYFRIFLEKVLEFSSKTFCGLIHILGVSFYAIFSDHVVETFFKKIDTSQKTRIFSMFGPFWPGRWRVRILAWTQKKFRNMSSIDSLSNLVRIFFEQKKIFLLVIESSRTKGGGA